jgi:hypothetical protein
MFGIEHSPLLRIQPDSQPPGLAFRQIKTAGQNLGILLLPSWIQVQGTQLGNEPASGEIERTRPKVDLVEGALLWCGGALPEGAIIAAPGPEKPQNSDQQWNQKSSRANAGRHLGR